MTTPDRLGGDPEPENPYHYALPIALSLFIAPEVQKPDYDETLTVADAFRVNPDDQRPITEQALDYARRSSENTLNFAVVMALRGGANDLHTLNEGETRGFLTEAAKDTVSSILSGRLLVADQDTTIKSIQRFVTKINRTKKQGPLPPTPIRPQR